MSQNKTSQITKEEEKFIKIARDIIKNNPEVFEALMEFERTKKIPKLTRKERINITIDSDLIKKFRDYCRKNNKVMSQVIERNIKEELGKKRL